ncbi:MAG: hypothetical protein COB51_04770 [Moraxellaceae bacterium]|nr:MAG: hypothetical protein COB51_04770 [Moraxellaceae bacterium]
MNGRWKGFVFVDIDEDLLLEEHDLGYGLVLRKATLEEISHKFTIGAFKSWSEKRGTLAFPNQRMPPPGDDGCYKGSTIDDIDAWRYAVIDCKREGIQLGDVNLAFSLFSADLRMGHVVFENSTTHSTPSLHFPMLNIRNGLGGMFIDHKLPSFEGLPELKENIGYVLSSDKKHMPSEIQKIRTMFTE